MSEAETLFEPSSYVATDARGLLCGFEPGTRTLSAGYRVDPRFRALPIDVVFDKDVAVTLRDGVTIYVDVLRPAGTERVPVIVAWSPYGKSQRHRPERHTICSTCSAWTTAALSGSGEVRRTRPGVLVRARATRSATPIPVASPSLLRRQCRCSAAKRARTATI